MPVKWQNMKKKTDQNHDKREQLKHRLSLSIYIRSLKSITFHFAFPRLNNYSNKFIGCNFHKCFL